MRDELIETLDYAIDNATKSKEHGGRAQFALNLETLIELRARAATRTDGLQVVPDGYALVPIEPTQAMLTILRSGDGIDNRKTYRALIAAALIECIPKSAANDGAQGVG